MIVGVPKEIKNNENRVALTPAGAQELTRRGHTVYIQASAGEGSGFNDEEYVGAGGKMLSTAEEVFATAEMIMKVKEPIEQEYNLIRKDQLVFTYFHFASYEPLTHAMIKTGGVCLAYETVERVDGSLPLLVPMSEVAGRMAIQEGAKYLEKPLKGRGILMGADVIITDVNLNRLRYLDDVMPKNVRTMVSNDYVLRELVKTHDLIVGAVLIPGAKAPKLITKDMLKMMRAGTVLVDVAVDQGGCIETCKPTTHENPTYIIDDVVHYCVANMPGAVPYTSTLALTNATLPYAIKLASNGWQKACQESMELRKGLNVIGGKVVYKAVADAFSLPYTDVKDFLG